MSDKASHIFEHLAASQTYGEFCSTECVTLLYSAASRVQLKIEEARDVNWEKANQSTIKCFVYYFLFIFAFLVCPTIVIVTF